MIAEPLSILLLAVTTSASPPATPDDCRADITVAYTRLTLAQIGSQAEWAAATMRTQPPVDERNLRELRGLQTLPIRMGSMYRDASISRCIADQWSSRVTRCYLGATSYDAIDACIRELSHDQCMKLDADTRFVTHAPGLGGGCGEPARDFTRAPRLREPHPNL